MNLGRIALSATAVVVAASAGHAELALAVTENQSLISFDTDDPTNISTGNFITGLEDNEVVLGIDVRPATNEVFAVGSFNNLYTLDTTTGAATLVGSGDFDPELDGINFGFDFNPTIDRIRNVSSTDQNLVLNPNDGGSTGVTSLFYGAGDENEGNDPNVVHSAYTNSVAGASSTQLYGIDSGLDVLVTQANSAGTLGTVGELGIDVSEVGGFDISGATGTAYLASVLDGQSVTNLYTVDLSSGDTTLLGEIAGGSEIVAFTVVPAPASAFALVAGAPLAMRRRRS